MKLIVFALVCQMALSFGAHAQEFDAPNSDLENRLYQIFQKSGQPVPADKWDSMVQNSKIENYKIQPGDTLWDVSQTFFGDGNYWSKVWAENGVIENPHQILPGRFLQFAPGSAADAPSIQVTTTESAAPPALPDMTSVDPALPEPPPEENSSTLELVRPPLAIPTDNLAQESVLPEPQIVLAPIPPPLRPPSPPVRRLPKSFVTLQPPEIGEYDSTGLQVQKMKALEDNEPVILNSYIAETRPQGIGEITEVEAGETTAGPSQYVFVQLKRGANVGDSLSVVYPQAPVEAPDGRKVGIWIEVGGIVQITDVVNADKFLYRALVIHAVNAVRTGSVIVEESLPRGNFANSGELSREEATIIGGELGSKRRVLGTGGVVFLDKGTSSGLAEGQIMGVKALRSSRKPDSKLGSVTRANGLIKLVKVYSKVATAYILAANDEIRAGDKTGGNPPEPESRPLGISSQEFDVESETQRQQQKKIDEELELELE